MRNWRPKGLALGSVLLVLAVSIAVLFLAVSASLAHLSVVNSRAQREHARNLAESAIALAIDKLVTTDFTFGKSPTDRVVATISGLDDAEGIVTFDPSELADAYSTYNIQSDNSKVGAGGLTVPVDSVHLVARGRVGEVQQWVECVYHRPPFPDGLVCSGKIQASGLVLTGVKNGGAYPGGDPRAMPEKDKTLANVFSNALTGGSTPCVELGPGCEINGSVGSRGDVKIDPANIIRGEVLPNSDARPLPSINIKDRIDSLLPNCVNVGGTSGSLALDPDWFSHSATGVNIGGDLDLNGTTLCVEGDLTVGGAIKGTGIILCTGTVEVMGGGSNVVTSSQVAIAAAGDVKLHATTPDGNYFQGLLFSQGDIEANDITVVGTAVASEPTPGSKGNIKLDNVRFVRTPASVNINTTAMKGYGFGGRAGALSVTLTLAPDGKTYLADVRAAFSIDSDADDPDKIDLPIIWNTLGDTPAYKTWKGINVGEPGPNFGQALGTQIGQWAANYSGQSKWITQFGGLLTPLLNQMVSPVPDQYKLSFSLNTLLAEEFGQSRVLLWRDFRKS